MIKKVKDINITDDELSKIDFYYDQHIEELLQCDVKDIIYLIDKTEEVLGYSLTKLTLGHYISQNTISLNVLFDETKIELYKIYMELINYYSFDDYSLGFSMGDYYLENDNKEEALKYYKMTFKEGYDLSNYNYYYSLKRYLNLLNINPKEEIIKLINASPKDEYNLDFINTYLLLIINLDKDDERYIKYIDEAIDCAYKVVNEIQGKDKLRFSTSDSDEERDLCELITLKMEYYVEKRDYVKSYELYKLLTKEIATSDCTRYYHARDKFYSQMLKYMSKEYPELKFFENIGYHNFLVVDDIKNINDYLNKEITLEKETKERFKFIITYVHKDNENVTIVPILPIIGLGGNIYVQLVRKDSKLYMVNKLSH